MMKKQKRAWHSRLQPFDYFNYILLFVLMLLVIIPFFYTIVKSLMTQQEYVMNGSTLWPKEPTLSNYKIVFIAGNFGRAFLNSVFYTVVGVAWNLFITVTLAYGLSKRNYPGRSMFQNMVIIIMYFGGGLIPFFLVIKTLGLMGTRWAVILPFGLEAYNMIIMRTFFEQFPAELEEAAKLDGANPFQIFFRIVLPLTKAPLATLTLFFAMDRWNEWFFSSLFLGNSKLWPVQLQLRQILWATSGFMKNVPAEAGRKVFSEGLKSAAVIITMIPIMLVYPFLQKYFTKGVMIGAIKS